MEQQRSLDYSIIIPVYCNEGSIEFVLENTKNEVIAKNKNLSAEIIFVDDGSKDTSFQVLQKVQEENPGLVRVIKLTRNFGQVFALIAGYENAYGKCVVSMSADGQEPVDIVNRMLDAFFVEGYEVVIGTRKEREESFYRSITSKIFYTTIKRISIPEMPEGGFDFVLMGRRALSVFLRNCDANLFFQGQILWTGYQPKYIEYKRLKRHSGTSKWTFAKKLTMFIDGVMSFSFYPIRVMSISGIILSLIGFLYALVVIIGKLFWGNPVQGWTPLMVVILVLGGFQLMMLGILGEYQWRVLSQVRNRDKYVIERIIESEKPVEVQIPTR